jgi:hypothetical protein
MKSKRGGAFRLLQGLPNNSLKPTRLAGEKAGASCLPASYRMWAQSLSRRAA